MFQRMLCICCCSYDKFSQNVPLSLYHAREPLIINILTLNFVRTRSNLCFTFTVDVEHSHVRFLGNLVLNLWDCGG